MLVGSVLPLRQRSIGREGGGRLRPGLLPAPGAADEQLSRRREVFAVLNIIQTKSDACQIRASELRKAYKLMVPLVLIYYLLKQYPGISKSRQLSSSFPLDLIGREYAISAAAKRLLFLPTQSEQQKEDSLDHNLYMPTPTTN
ncbi:hypothetical protein NDU88_005400 [Pleurodeles waltl]|uniref:Uncharacterized protein n=1 Tax=Pleurodeles waltl TaxID=8319 RepID=A0AAV7WXI2_PLEWA|nr:hypothetical protein NDU88_005400 [Pleurodeles waltl]